MAKTSLITKSARLRKKHLLAKREGRKIKFSTRVYNRCGLCGRPRGYIRKFDMCRICVRQHASNDMIMGLRKASW